MELLLGVLAGLVLAFGLVLFVGAPYLPTLRPQVETAFELLALKPGQTVLELGCGDGKVLLAAAQAGYKAVGVELNPILAFISWLRTVRYRKQVRVVWGNYWRMRWPEADGVFVFLLDSFMPKLDTHMQQYKKPLASVAFQVPGRRADAEKNGVFLYNYR